MYYRYIVRGEDIESVETITRGLPTVGLRIHISNTMLNLALKKYTSESFNNGAVKGALSYSFTEEIEKTLSINMQ
jgi:hypothetical protein